MRRITKVAIISTVAGSTLFVGAQFAFPASADDGDWADWCASRPGIPPSFSPTSTPTFSPTSTPTSPPSDDPTAPPSDDPTATPTGDPTLSPMSDGRALHAGAGSSADASRSAGPRPSGSARRHHWRRHWWGWRRPNCPSTPPSGSPTTSPTGSPTTSPTASTTPSSTPPSSKPPTSVPPSSKPPTSPSPSCTTAAGAASNVESPGVGAVTVTIKVCNGQLTSSTGSISQSNWSANTAAFPALDTLAVQYYKTDVTKIHHSGATLTSKAYQASLKSALTKAGL